MAKTTTEMLPLSQWHGAFASCHNSNASRQWWKIQQQCPRSEELLSFFCQTNSHTQQSPFISFHIPKICTRCGSSGMLQIIEHQLRHPTDNDSREQFWQKMNVCIVHIGKIALRNKVVEDFRVKHVASYMVFKLFHTNCTDDRFYDLK